ncbi:glycosyltransferase [Rhodopirellula baltica]|uniref:Glycosyl transferase group 1 n=1 Tax=Rhodopirellula baltica SWK14 TaxID=993516 RepID=L7CLB2_RHOBT|nr:glycosyltransferase [Rhodopirellula baltica]ELP34407.1 glycosyl transferase group 1 [Rhodopirellula baltica SWK14]
MIQVLITGTCFSPSYGGPARSVAQLADAIATLGVRVGMWAPDGSGVEAPYLPSGSCVERLSGDFKEALEEFGKPDLIHDNGLWLPHNHSIASYACRHSIPRVLSTRGMLEPWARKHKRVRKCLAWHAYQRRDLNRAFAIHTTSEQEQQTLMELQLSPRLWTIPNGISPPHGIADPTLESGFSRSEGKVKVALFMGRLYPVKGLPMLLQSWAKVRPPRWCLKIAGPDEAGHRSVLERMVVDFALQDSVEFAGAVEGDAKWKAMRGADLFICPSYSENFGIAIAEAMSCGVPVITTTGTPWRVLETNRMGWWVPADVDSLTNALVAATREDPDVLQKMGTQCRAHVREFYQWPNIAQQMLGRYKEVIEFN